MKTFKKNLTTVTTPQAAEMLNVTPQCVRKMVMDGRLSGSQPEIRGDWKVDLVAVHTLQAQRQRIAASKLEQQARTLRVKGGTRTILAGTLEDDPPPVQADLSRLAGAGRLVRIEQRLTEIEAVLEQLAKVWDV